jgi:hypothetical protein
MIIAALGLAACAGTQPQDVVYGYRTATDPEVLIISGAEAARDRLVAQPIDIEYPHGWATQDVLSKLVLAARDRGVRVVGHISIYSAGASSGGQGCRVTVGPAEDYERYDEPAPGATPEYRCRAEFRETTTTEPMLATAWDFQSQSFRQVLTTHDVKVSQYQDVCGMAPGPTLQTTHGRWDLIAAPPACSADPGAHDHVEALFYTRGPAASAQAQ